MTPETLAFIGTCDLSGLLRGVSVPWAELERHMGRGVAVAGSTPLLLPFGPPAEAAFAAADDLVLLPDPATQSFIPAPEAPDIVLLLADLLERDGAPWECCPRYFLRRGLAALHAEFGLTLQASFSQALHYDAGGSPAAAQTLDSVRQQGAFGGTLLAALRANGITPAGFEAAGMRQFKVAAAASPGVGAADAAVLVRELARAVATRLGRRAVLAPLPCPGAAGNAMRIGGCLLDQFGRSAMNDEAGEHGLSFEGEYWLAGILSHLPAITAVLAPSVVSYDRLRAAQRAQADLAVEGRGGAVRLFAPDTGEDDGSPQLQIEVQVADAAASPYLALGALVWAGLDGLRRQRRLAELQRTPLPTTLLEALDQFEESVPVAEWFGPVFREAYLRFKRAEVAALAGLDAAAVCARYAAVY